MVQAAENFRGQKVSFTAAASLRRFSFGTYAMLKTVAQTINFQINIFVFLTNPLIFSFLISKSVLPLRQNDEIKSRQNVRSESLAGNTPE
jgi:hypothetical protein